MKPKKQRKSNQKFGEKGRNLYNKSNQKKQDKFKSLVQSSHEVRKASKENSSEERLSSKDTKKVTRQSVKKAKDKSKHELKNKAVKDPITTCPIDPPITKINDCKKIKDNVQEGDIVLRGQRNDDSSKLISKISKCDYSHAGIVSCNDKGELVVVDAYPGRGTGDDEDLNAVGSSTLDDFFCGHGATHGLVSRPKDSKAAKKAAKWALEQTKDPDYKFDLYDPWNEDPKKLYCADFVYQSFENAGVDLVPKKMDFLSEENKENTLSVARDSMKNDYGKVKTFLATDKQLEEGLKKNYKSTEYITPCQVADNSNMDTKVKFDTDKSKLDKDNVSNVEK